MFLEAIMEISRYCMGFKTQTGILWELGVVFEARAASAGPQGRAGGGRKTRKSLKMGLYKGLWNFFLELQVESLWAS